MMKSLTLCFLVGSFLMWMGVRADPTHVVPIPVMCTKYCPWYYHVPAVDVPTPVPSPSPKPVSSPIASTVGAPTAVMASMLNDHNKYRKIHHAPPLRWNASIANATARWVNKCNITHDSKSVGVYGENLLWGSVSPRQAIADAPRIWYNEVKTYNYSKPVANHFTQMVWKSTTALGCAYKKCGSVTFLACRYWVPGNVPGKFKTNVVRP